MQIRITLTSDSTILLPIHYNEHVQAMLYRYLDRDIATRLHNEGFRYRKRSFKLFTFSRIHARSRYDRRNKLITFFPPIRIHFAFAVDSVGRSFLNNVIKADSIVLEGNLLQVADVQISSPAVGEEMRVKTLSPITVYRTHLKDGRKRTTYYPPDSPEFPLLIKLNLLRKYETLYGREYPSSLEVEVLKRGKMAIIKYKGTVIKAWDAHLLLTGEPEILKLALGAGLGAKNSQGFGMVILT